MNSVSGWMSAWQLLGPLALEVTFIIGTAALLQRLVRSVLWRRAIWQACGVSLAALVLFEATGLAPAAAVWIRTNTAGAPLTQPTAPFTATEPTQDPTVDPLQVSDDFRVRVAARMAVDQYSESTNPPKPDERVAGPSAAVARTVSMPSMTNSPKAPDAHRDIAENLWSDGSSVRLWLGLIWLFGTGLIAARICFGRFVFMLFRWRGSVVSDEALQERVRRMAEQLGIRRSIQITESPRLAGPIAFGVLRPAIALPKEFSRQFSPIQQEVVLAHELAHLAAFDPAWHYVADFVTALLWWHPLVWWQRNQLQSATESAADEASLLVANGPTVLAECLLQVGARLVSPRSFGWLGIEGNGFRSGLGRRVERLIHLHGHSWCPPKRLWTGLAKSLGSVTLIALAIFTTAWISPATFSKGETMKTLPQTWKQSLSIFAFVSAIAPGSDRASAASPADPAAVPASVSAERAPQRPVEVNTAVTPENENYSLLFGRLASEESDKVIPVLKEMSIPYRIGPGGASVYVPQDKVHSARMRLAEKGLPRSNPNGQAGFESSTKARSEDKQGLRAKLDRIVLTEVQYDGLPLSEVVKQLSEEARKRDPEKLGINFLISNAKDAPPGAANAVDPNTGQPLEPTEVVDLNNVIIRLNLPLRNVRLRQVLDVIATVAEQPIHYTIENYGVVLAAGNPPPASASAAEADRARTYRMDPELMKRYGLLPPNTTQNAPAPVPPALKAKKLETIVLNEVQFDGAPLSKVAKFLSQKSSELDPDKQGINFIINPRSTAANQPFGIDPTTGQPLPSPELIDPNNVIIRFNLPLRNVRLNDVLDAITRVADRPIQYSVEDYGVVFSLDPNQPATPTIGGGLSGLPPFLNQRQGRTFAPPQSDALEARTFRVDTNTFVKGLESAFGITVGGTVELIPLDVEKQRIELGLAEKELEETEKRAKVGVATSDELLRATAAVELLKATNEQQKVQIRLRLADRQLQSLARMVETGNAPKLDYDRAKAAKEVLELDLKSIESGRPLSSAIRTVPSRTIQQALRQLWSQLGANMEAPGKAVFYNELTGIVMVRATAEDLKTIQAAMETLGATAAGESRMTVSVLGAVIKPSAIKLAPGQRTSILEAIAEAGGFKPTANKNRIEVSRNGQVTRFKFDDLRKAHGSDKVFWLESGDVILVNEVLF